MSAVATLRGETPQQVRSLGEQFTAYNFREYAKRRTRDAFHEHKAEKDSRKVQELIQKGLKELQAMKTRRANRAGYAEHDDFEGLPVRQWRQEWVNVAPPIEQEVQQVNDVWASELIHGMPKDSGLLTPHSQELLRAARSGRLYKRTVPTDEDEAETENVNEKPEKKEEEPAPKGYSVKIWKQIPRNVEAPEITRLAKRRKNTVTIASKTPEEKAQGSTVTRATVRRVDAAGNPYTEEVTLAEGQAVSGEIISTRVETLQAPAAPLTQVQPHRRRPPPPKRKTKAGPGRGKKKNRGGIAGGPPHISVPNGDGVAMPSQATTAENGTTNEANGASHRDTEMADGDDDESDDGDEGDEDDEEHGDSDHPDTSLVEESKDKDQTMTDAPPIPAEVKEMVADAAAADKLPANHLTLPPPLATLASDSSKVEGSPLKNVVLPSPTEINMSDVPQVIAKPVDAETGSTVAEPPSTIVGEEPEAAENRDLELAPTPSGALLPPPPEQVGNIATPKADDASSRVSDNDDKSKESEHMNTDSTEKSFRHQDSLMTEDSIKPEDSASVRFPLTESGAPSEVGTGSVDEAKEPAGAATPGPVEREAHPEPSFPPVIPEEPVAEAEPEQSEAIVPEEPKEEQEHHREEPMPEEPPAPAPVAVEEPAPETTAEFAAPALQEPEPVVPAPAEPESQPQPEPEVSQEKESVEPSVPEPIPESAGETTAEEPPALQLEERNENVMPEEPPATQSEPVEQPSEQPAEQPVTEPVTEPVAVPIVEPVTEPEAEPLAPAAEPAPTASEPKNEDDATAA
ncbi:hypothetical protein ISF_02558 [Cordyceps fumosorosea ARSEF 2679]|uniref:Complex 1 LYR protein domain-containing protein n=1 Tax=Cordyceps fumosorosea (strain ARSEF 2679) TaxID=1081104 RepID=A0A162LHB1_CORFA|nr:hypothetical protein ISF_02558 [Cordyceps fumosorosea ARSEF 2679]OAA70584.1 hypothetical protein ISF_02558 [Cordyceps fumosorosea ARSEF 2679]